MGFVRSTGKRSSHKTPRTATTGLLLAGLSASLFLGGGVATYLEPQLTAPLYIAGSIVMLINTLCATGRLQRRNLILRTATSNDSSYRADRFERLALRALTVATVLVGAFWSGYLM